MIKKLLLENYRCFEKSEVIYKDLSIFVGKNNAGKSSMIEALRMVAYASQKSSQTTYKEAPYGLGVSGREKGIKIDVDKLKIDLRGIVYLYENKIAKVIAEFDDGCKIIILCNDNIAFAFLYSPDDKNIKLKNNAMKYNFSSISILPQIGLIKENEKLLSEDTVNNYKETYLSSRHFRNEIKLYKKEYWSEFCQTAESTWDLLKIISLDYDVKESEFLRLMVSDSKFVAELGLMGSGLQMWLQIIWFICRNRNKETIILDEPDVYMHPDLQLKLLHLIQIKYKQIIIATHSVEIISDVSAANIVMIDKKKRKMRYANNSAAVQQIIENIGGIQNLSLIRIGLCKKCLFVEGKDIKFLSKIYDKLYPEQDNCLNSLPIIELHGFSKLNEAFGASKLFYNETGGEIKCFCILDRDYYPSELLKEKTNLSEENHLNLHIWNRKEIENYFIIPDAIFRLTKQPENKYPEVIKELDDLVETFKDVVMDQFSEQIRNNNPGIAISTSNSKAREIMKEKWLTLENKIAMVSGKELVKKINFWLKEKYNINSSMDKIIKEIKNDEIPSEMIEVINVIADIDD